ALAGGTAERLPLPHPLPAGRGALRRGGADHAARGRRPVRRLPLPARRRSTHGGRRRRSGGRRGGDALTAMEPAATSAPETRRSRLDPEERRAQIVAVAAEVFRGRDPASVRFDEIAQAAGVSRSLVYAYFSDRGELIAAVHLHLLSDLDAELSALPADVPVDEARLGSVVRHFLELAERNADSWRLFAAAGAVQHPAVQAARRDRCQRIADTWGGGPA